MAKSSAQERPRLAQTAKVGWPPAESNLTAEGSDSARQTREAVLKVRLCEALEERRLAVAKRARLLEPLDPRRLTVAKPMPPPAAPTVAKPIPPPASQRKAPPRLRAEVKAEPHAMVPPRATTDSEPTSQPKAPRPKPSEEKPRPRRQQTPALRAVRARRKQRKRAERRAVRDADAC